MFITDPAACEIGYSTARLTSTVWLLVLFPRWTPFPTIGLILARRQVGWGGLLAQKSRHMITTLLPAAHRASRVENCNRRRQSEWIQSGDQLTLWWWRHENEWPGHWFIHGQTKIRVNRIRFTVENNSIWNFHWKFCPTQDSWTNVLHNPVQQNAESFSKKICRLFFLHTTVCLYGKPRHGYKE